VPPKNDPGGTNCQISTSASRVRTIKSGSSQAVHNGQCRDGIVTRSHSHNLDKTISAIFILTQTPNSIFVLVETQ
jgi:hypothetical protein